MISGRPQEMEPMLARGGVMGALICERDWAGTAVGVMEAWPQSLRTALSVCLLIGIHATVLREFWATLA